MADDGRDEFGRASNSSTAWEGLEAGPICEALPVSNHRRSTGKLPAAIIISVVIQVGGLIWLSASVLTRVEERLAQHGDRLIRFDAAHERLADSLTSVSERLARAEENINNQLDLRRGESRLPRTR